ncbi:MAG: CinA family nicotinamide mononucleotide deamidase-related protein [Bacteroidales bacterium]|nr:CinA family nicotinamide mononucleotide deamidase-related protein [Bacteroidales bacterium]
MKTVIINVGDELLSGRTVNTNATFIARHLTLLGFDVIKIIIVKDKEKEIKEALSYATKNSVLSIITGGLGPTIDDITKKTIANFFLLQLEFNSSVWENVQAYLKKRNIKISKNTMYEAMIPQTAIIFENNLGSAPGFAIETNNHTLIALPGIPYEAENIFTTSIISYLKTKFNIKPNPSCVFIFTNISESELAIKLKKWEKIFCKNNIKIAYLPSPGIVKIIINYNDTYYELISKFKAYVNEHLKKYILHDDDHSLPEILKLKLLQAKATLCTAESCTGGYLSHLITSVAGSSEYYKGSIIAYSNEVKSDILKVDSSILKKHGAVSKEVVEAMALNAIKILNTTHSIAISGIAGPSGGSPKKPVGTTWISVASEKQIFSQKFSFSSNRLVNIQRAAIAGIVLLIQKFLK